MRSASAGPISRNWSVTRVTAGSRPRTTVGSCRFMWWLHLQNTGAAQTLIRRESTYIHLPFDCTSITLRSFDDKRQKLFLHQWSNGPLRIERTKARKTFCSCVIIKSGVTSKMPRRYHEVIRRRRHCSQSHAFELSISRVELESKSNRSCNRPFSGVSRRRR